MIVIVGGGLAGLTAARELQAEGITDFILVEANERLGGRVSSKHVDGFILDAGFQVLNPAYESIHNYFDIDNLELGYFDSGAKLLSSKGRHQNLVDPLQHPEKLIQTALNPPFAISDLMKLGVYRLISLGSVPSNFEEASSLLETEVQKLGVHKELINQFLRPFFAGVLLSHNLESTPSYFKYLYKLFGRSKVGLPKKGMSALAEELARPIPRGQVLLCSRVKSHGDNRVELEDGSSIAFSKLILATEFNVAAKLLGAESPAGSWRGVHTHYFQASESPWAENLLGLLPWGESSINHVALLSKAQNSYAPKGKHLVCVNELSLGETPAKTPEQILEALSPYKLPALQRWEHLATESVLQALPSHYLQGSQSDPKPNVVLAGDYTETPSIGGAMLSGQKAAQKVLTQLRR